MNIKTTVRLLFVALVSAVAIIACREDRRSVNDPISASGEANGNYAWIYSVTLDSGHGFLPERRPRDTVAAVATWRPIPARYRYKCGSGNYGSWKLFSATDGKAVLTCTGIVATLQAGLNDSLNTSTKGHIVIDTGTNRVRVVTTIEVDLDDPAIVDSIKWPQYASYPYYVLHTDVPRAEAKFGYYRNKLLPVHSSKSGVYGENGHYSCVGNCLNANDTLFVTASEFFGKGWLQGVQSAAHAVIAHEFGHAFHGGTLGGSSAGACHSCSSGTSIGEPLADVIASYVSGYRQYADSINYWQGWGYNYVNGPDDYILERNFQLAFVDTSNHNNDPVWLIQASFLYDLIDVAADSNGPLNQSGADDDSLGYNSSTPAKYLGDLVSAACSTKTSDGVWHSPPSELAQVVACAERQSPPTFLNNVPTWFQNNWKYMSTGQLREITAYLETITEPPNWNYTKIRQNWMYNIYESSSGP